jgi:Family of unknown function (DUF6303)
MSNAPLTSTTGRAQVTMGISDGVPSRAWRMIVAHAGRVAEWPSAMLGFALPNPDARESILKGFGWDVVPGSVWAWSEDVYEDGTPILTGQIDVCRQVTPRG